MLGKRLDVGCKVLSDEIKVSRGKADQLQAKLGAKEHTKAVSHRFADYCRKVEHALKTVSIPFEKKREILTAFRATVLAHSNRAQNCKQT